MYREGFVKRDEGGTYICLERRTKIRRRTSVLLLSYGKLGPGSDVDPTPFSLHARVRQGTDFLRYNIPNDIVDFVVVDLQLRGKGEPTTEE